MDFKEKYGSWALVTGATSGIGKELANGIAAKGVNIIQVARKKAELEKNEQHLRSKYGVEVRSISADLAEAKEVEKVIESTAGLPVGLLVIAAALEVNGAFGKAGLDRERNLLQLNIMTTMQLAYHFIPQMTSRVKADS